MDCGPACLRMVAQAYGKHYRLETLRERCFITREGVSMLGIAKKQSAALQQHVLSTLIGYK
jgi:ABC-type bacteriocin/lantibiotic exporter with double-glycine peptidase domain